MLQAVPVFLRPMPGMLLPQAADLAPHGVRSCFRGPGAH